MHNHILVENPKKSSGYEVIYIYAPKSTLPIFKNIYGYDILIYQNNYYLVVGIYNNQKEPTDFIHENRKDR